MNIYQQLVLVVILVFVGSTSYAQEQIIHAIYFENIKHNKENYLRYKLNSTVQENLNYETINRDVRVLNSLPSVAKTTYQIDTIDGGVDLTFIIEEAITSFPFFNVGLIEGNAWFSVGYGGLNLFGNGHQLKGVYQFSDQNHNFDLFYRVPFWGKSKWGNTLGFSRYGSLEPLFFDEGAVFYNFEIQTVTTSLSYGFSPNHSLEIGGSFFKESYLKADEQQLDFTPGPDALNENKGLFKIVHQINRVDYDYHRLNGLQGITTFQFIKNLTANSTFNNFVCQINAFKIIKKKGNLAARLRFGIANNNDSPFAPFVVDSYINIRGIGNRVDRGTAQLILNTEYRHQIFHKKSFASQLVIFSDQGNWRVPGGAITDLVTTENYVHFVGGGIRLIYTKGYNFILRADYGFDISKAKYNGFVLGIGQYF